VCGLLVTYVIVFPLSLARNPSALVFSSGFGVLCAIYLSIAVTIVFIIDDSITSSIYENFNKMEAVKFTENGLISSFPLIVYAYMY
jgi:hypothetical protein